MVKRVMLRPAAGLKAHITDTRLAWFMHECGGACFANGVVDDHTRLKVAEELRRSKAEHRG